MGKYSCVGQVLSQYGIYSCKGNVICFIENLVFESKCRLECKIKLYFRVVQKLWEELGVESPQQQAAKVRLGLSTSSPVTGLAAEVATSTAGASSLPPSKLDVLPDPMPPLSPQFMPDLNISLPTVRLKRLSVWAHGDEIHWSELDSLQTSSRQLAQLPSPAASGAMHNTPREGSPLEQRLEFKGDPLGENGLISLVDRTRDSSGLFTHAQVPVSPLQQNKAHTVMPLIPFNIASPIVSQVIF
jgi:hypothetical protein